MTEELLPLCECGCRLRVTKPGNRFIHGHNRRGVSLPHTPETCATMSVSHTGVPHSPEHSAAIARSRTPEFNSAMSDTMKNSDAHKASVEKQRGGLDLVTHHYIYDHNDLSLNTVQMARSDHGKLHTLLKKLGYIIPHINLPDEPAKETREEVL